MVVGLAILCDTFTGIYKSVKLDGWKSIRSRKLSNIISKMVLYEISIIVLFPIDKFLLNEEKRWTCKTCGQGLCVHRKYCLNCKTEFTKMQLED